MECFLVAEARFASSELRGLDEIVEIFAVERPLAGQPATEAAAPWGPFWLTLLEGAALPEGIVASDFPPEEGGLLLRALRPASAFAALTWEADSRRHLMVPPRSAHLSAGLPRPRSVSNDLFIEVPDIPH